jgi:pSer/pThr/pTyr-binding forkhead associated (FHA) protein
MCSRTDPEVVSEVILQPRLPLMSQYPTNLLPTSCAAVAPLELTVSGPGWDGGERHVFEQPFVLIGREERNDLRLDDEAVSRRHAYLQQMGERVFCIDLGSRTGTHWAGEARPAGWLRPNQGIQIGPFTLELAKAAWTGGIPNEEGAEAGNPLQDRMNGQLQFPMFRIAVGNEVRSQFRMNRELVLVGSAPECRVRLRDAGISRYHCSLVKTPEGLWVLDLLSTTGTRLNGEPIRWARVNEGDLLRVGPYLLRLSYEDEIAPNRSMSLPASRMEAPLRESDEPSKSERMPDRAPALQAELDQLRERLRDTETLRQQLTDRETECVRLREQADTFNKQTAEIAELKARLEVTEAVARKLEEICSERDHWQTQANALQSRIASDLAEREDLRQQLEDAKRQLAGEREALHAANVQLDQQSTTLQQLRETHDELSRLREETGELRAELEQAREHQKDAQALRQQLADASSKHDELIVRVRQLEDKAASADALVERLREADAEKEQLREQLRAGQSQGAELEALRLECVQLREQVRAFEIQVSQMEDLKCQLESAADKLDDVCSQRDHWQTEAHALRTQIDSAMAEREQLRQQLETAQQQLVQEREAVRAANVRLEQQSAVLQQLQETPKELAQARNKMLELQAELDRASKHQQDVELLRRQLTDTRSKHDELAIRVLELQSTATSADRLADRLREADAETERLRQQVRVLELRVTEADDLIARLESAEADARNLEEVRSERDHWQVEAQTLRNRIASDMVERERFVRVTEELLAVQDERDRLLAEQQTSVQQDKQESARAADLERALAEATDAHEKALSEERARWESERQALKTLIEQARTTDHQSAQAAIREAQARFAAEREELRLRLEGAEAQIVWERGLFQEQSEQLRKQVSALQAERDRLLARQTQPVSFLASAEERSQDKADRPAETSSARQATVQDQALALFFGLGVGHPHEQSARPQAANKPSEQARPRVQPSTEWSQGGQQVRLDPVEQGVEDAWMEAAARSQGPAIQADGGQPSTPPDTTPAEATTAVEGEPEEISDARLPQPKDEEQSGLWRKIVNLVRRK